MTTLEFVGDSVSVGSQYQALHTQFKRHVTPWLGVIILLMLCQPGVSLAEWAEHEDEVNCHQCVDNSDIAKDTITSNRIKNGTIKNADIKADSIRSNRIKDGTIQVIDLSLEAQQALVGPTGLQGIAGADGSDGVDGADSTVPGPPGPAGLGAVIDTRAPTGDDDMNSPYSLGSIWIDTLAANAYILVDDAPNAAVWKRLGGPPPTYAVGDTGPAGGIVFYVTDSGLHGLEASPSDQAIPYNPGAPWGCWGQPISGADGTAIGTGQQNTADILVGCGDRPIAASIAAAYPGPNGDSLGDWFLPSKDELNVLYAYKDVVGGFASNYYWSSSEIDDYSAWFQFFDNGNQTDSNTLSANGVRAVRAF